MKIAVSSHGSDLDTMVDPRFGRCRFFVVVDLSTEEFEAVDNQAAEMSGGAGIQAAQMVINLDIDAVITGSLGPNAADTLAVAGVKAYLGASKTVREALRQYKAGRLREAVDRGGMGSSRGPGGGMGRGRGLGRGRGGGTGRAVGRRGF